MVCCRHVPVGTRQQFPVLSAGGDPGIRGCTAHNSESPRGLLQPGLHQTHLARPSAPPHQPGAAPFGLQWALWSQGGSDRPLRGQGGPGLPLRCGPNGSGPHAGPDFSGDPGTEVRCQWTVAKVSEALQGKHFNKAQEQSEAEYQLQGNQKETVQFRGPAHCGVLLTRLYSCTSISFLEEKKNQLGRALLLRLSLFNAQVYLK